MTPVEKANELVFLMFNCDKFTDDTDMAMLYPHALQCAIIAVDEIMRYPKTLLYDMSIYRFREFNEMDINSWENEDSIIFDKMTALEFWNEVKHELEYMYTKQLTK
jgi:hypothetical protein